MFTGIHFIPQDTKIGFVRLRTITWVISALLTVVPLLLVWKVGLNFGIDFQGGTLIEIQTKESVANLGDIRSQVSALGFGEVQIQEFGAPNAVLIRIAAQPTEKEQQESISKVKQALGDQVDYRRIEVVGPTVSSELIAGGTVAVVIAMIIMFLFSERISNFIHKHPTLKVLALAFLLLFLTFFSMKHALQGYVNQCAGSLHE